MKKNCLFLGALIFIYVSINAQSDYNQYEVLYVKPKLDKTDLFKKGLAAHNKKYHSKAPYKVSVSSIMTGPNSGDYVWVMGPTTWTQLDGAPGEGEQIMDWEKNVNPYCESLGETMFWRGEKDIYYSPEGANFKKSSMRASYVKPGQMPRFLDQMKKIAEMFKQKKYNASFSVAIRQGASTQINAVSFISFDKWAWMDRPDTWVKDFDEVHGQGAWNRFLEEIEICTDQSMSYTELSEEVADLGG